MAATDWPFSVTSKFLDAGGAEHLVTVRGQNLEAFASRLSEAATLFPYAGFTNGHATPTTAAVDPRVPEAQTPPEDIDTVRARLQANTNRRAPNANAPKCNIHNRPMLPSRKTGIAWYCPAKNQDGTYCTTNIAA